MKQDTESYVRRCNRCQRHAPISRVPSKALNPIISPWSFVQWGMDIVGPLPIGAAQKKFLLIATNYVSKWVKGEAYVSIKDKDVFKFVWKNIVYRFGIPRAIATAQFDSAIFRIFCLDLNIKNLYSTLRYLQSNRLVEATNKTPLNALKKRLQWAKGKWLDELPKVLWTYRTTSRWPTEATPFALTYGMEVIIPTKISMLTAKKSVQDQRDNI